MSREKKTRAKEDAPEEQGSAETVESGDSVEIETESQEIQEDSGTDADESTPESDEGSIEALVEEIASLKDQLLRKQADFENFRKRMVRDREEAIRYANTNLLVDLVDVIDNFERAIKSSEESEDFTSFYEGIVLIEKQFTSMLDSKYGLKRFESMDEEFDPEKHEAIAAMESEDVDTQTVIDDFQKGYMLHDRVLRHAKVRVAVPPAGNSQSAADEQNENE